jgi:hypothetical protein
MQHFPMDISRFPSQEIQEEDKTLDALTGKTRFVDRRSASPSTSGQVLQPPTVLDSAQSQAESQTPDEQSEGPVHQSWFTSASNGQQGSVAAEWFAEQQLFGSNDVFAPLPSTTDTQYGQWLDASTNQPDVFNATVPLLDGYDYGSLFNYPDQSSSDWGSPWSTFMAQFQ